MGAHPAGSRRGNRCGAGANAKRRRAGRRGGDEGADPLIQSTGVDRGVREHIRRLLASGCVEEIAIDEPLPPESLYELVTAAREAGRGVRVHAAVADLPPTVGGERWLRVGDEVPPRWRLAAPGRPLRRLAIKRLTDVVLAAILLLLLSPLMLAVTVTIRLTSAGPVLYRWHVVGRHGRRFTGYKFRTMIQDADRIKASLLNRNEMVGPVFKLADDPRLTPFGRWLRRYSLDELPQLWSVLKGDMSLVGPRPALHGEYQQFELWQMRKLTVTPGMTCLWQVRGRNAIKDFSEWVRLDLLYIDRWSLWLDLTILIRTASAVVRGTGR